MTDPRRRHLTLKGLRTHAEKATPLSTIADEYSVHRNTIWTRMQIFGLDKVWEESRRLLSGLAPEYDEEEDEDNAEEACALHLSDLTQEYGSFSAIGSVDSRQIILPGWSDSSPGENRTRLRDARRLYTVTYHGRSYQIPVSLPELKLAA